MGKIENLIRQEALLDNNTTHNKVCKSIINFAENNKIPITLLLYIAVGTTAHKEETFNNGYRKFQHEKAVSVLTLSDLFSKYFNCPKARTNEKVIHCCSRYYTYQGGNITNFNNILKTLSKDNFNISNFKSSKELGNFLFKEHSSFNDKGYITQTIMKKQY